MVAVSIAVIVLMGTLLVVMLRRRDRMRQLLERMESPTVRVGLPPEELVGLPQAGSIGRKDRPGTLLLYTSRGDDYVDVIGVQDTDGGVRFMRDYRPEDVPELDELPRLAFGAPYGPQRRVS